VFLETKMKTLQLFSIICLG